MRLHFYLVSVVLLTGCFGDGNGPVGALPPQFTKGVYILNEGNFTRGNSTLSFFLPDSNKVFADVFRTANGRDLGDTGNDIVVHGAHAYIVVNFSDKVEVISTNDHSSIATIPFLQGANPYKISIAPNLQKAYVTNLFQASVSVFDRITFEFLTEKIDVGENPQGVAFANGKVYVCNSGFGSGRSVSVIDASTDQVLKTITLSDGPANIGLDSDGSVWIVCSGDYGDFADPTDDTPGKLFALNPTTDEVVDSIEVGGHPGEIAFSNDGYVYVVGELGIIKVDTRTVEIVANPFIAGSFYTVAVDGITNEIYVADAKDFVQNGVVRVYSPSGVALNEFEVGIAPGSIAFVR